VRAAKTFPRQLWQKLDGKSSPVLVHASESAKPPPRKSMTPHGSFFSMMSHVMRVGDCFGKSWLDWKGQNL
jgi:hypothetical protein